MSIGYAEQGNRVQDIAAIRMAGLMVRETLNNLGYQDVQVNTVFHQYMAAFPETRDRAEELIYNSAITAALNGATRITHEDPGRLRIPTPDNLQGVGL